MADEKNMDAASNGKPFEAKPMPGSQDLETGTDVSPNQLSKEEQMARFEEDLKYNDWGHQPC